MQIGQQLLRLREVTLVSLVFLIALAGGCGGGSDEATTGGSQTARSTPAENARGGANAPAVGAPIIASDAAAPNEIDGTFVSSAAGQIWVATQHDGYVRRIDPYKQRLVGHPIFVAKRMVGLASTGHALWTIDQLRGRLARIDAASGKVRFIRLGSAYLPDLAVTSNEVWVSSNSPTAPGATLTRVDPRTGAVTRRIALDFATEQIEVSGDSLWATNERQRSVLQMNAASGRVVGKPVQVRQFPERLLATERVVWAVAVDPATSAERGELFRIDPRTHQAVRTKTVPAGVSSIVTGGGRLWLATRRAPQEGPAVGEVVPLDPSTGSALSAAIRVGEYPASLVFAFGALWVSDNIEHSIRRVNPDSDGSSQPPPPTPEQRRQQALLKRLKKASKVPPSRAQGCEPFRVEGVARALLGPPAPKISAHRAGQGVEISYRFAGLPGEDACRPYLLLLTVSSGRPRSASFQNWTEKERVTSEEGSRLLMPPKVGRRPIRATAAAVTISGRSGPRVTVRIR